MIPKSGPWFSEKIMLSWWWKLPSATALTREFPENMAIWNQFHRISRAAGFILFLMVPAVCSAAFGAETKQVMLLHSFGREVKPWSDFAQSIHSELERQSPWPLAITDHSLVSARSGDEDSEVPFVEYLGALFSKQPLDLIVSVGAPAAAFVQRHRQQLFATTPMVLSVVEQRRVEYSALTANDAVVPIRINYVAAIANILHVLPDTKNVAVVVGASPIEQFWREQIRKDVMPFTDRITFTFWDNLSFEDILKHAAALPPHSAIFWELMVVDAAGAVHNGDAAFTSLRAVANAPIFGYYEPNFGQGVVGGPYNAVLDSSRATAAVAVRILGGEKAGDIQIPPLEFATPKFDWREMQRWGISEGNLPPGSTIDFRAPTAWEKYDKQILAIGAAIIIQAALIGWLLHERQYRRRAERIARDTMSELTQMNRLATAGELSASIAHEINQPLTGMVLMASAALRRLAVDRPDIAKVRELVSDIINAGHRASDVVKSIRAMFKNETNERDSVDINYLVTSVLALVRTDLRKNGIEFRTQLDEQLPIVKCDRVQVQQVVLNLVMNAIESMHSLQPRVLKIQSERSKSDRSKSDFVHVSIEDTGTGVDPSNVDRVFTPLFTTKARGMGMGLSICRSIIESHGGRIWVSAGASRGSIFHFELPAKVGAYAG
jgi:signal transduction histidine kinase